MALIEINDQDLEFLRTLVHEMKTQENHCTASPYFYSVRTWRKMAQPSGFGEKEVWVDWRGPDSFYSFEDYQKFMIECCDFKGSEEELRERFGELDQYSETLIEEFHNVFLTQKGYEEHMRLNGHNYHHSDEKPSFFIKHAFRNPEIETLFKIIHKLGAK